MDAIQAACMLQKWTPTKLKVRLCDIDAFNLGLKTVDIRVNCSHPDSKTANREFFHPASKTANIDARQDTQGTAICNAKRPAFTTIHVDI
jgi:hypothetical protein